MFAHPTPLWLPGALVQFTAHPKQVDLLVHFPFFTAGSQYPVFVGRVRGGVLSGPDPQKQQHLMVDIGLPSHQHTANGLTRWEVPKGAPMVLSVIKVPIPDSINAQTRIKLLLPPSREVVSGDISPPPFIPLAADMHHWGKAFMYQLLYESFHAAALPSGAPQGRPIMPPQLVKAQHEEGIKSRDAFDRLCCRTVTEALHCLHSLPLPPAPASTRRKQYTFKCKRARLGLGIGGRAAK